MDLCHFSISINSYNFFLFFFFIQFHKLPLLLIVIACCHCGTHKHGYQDGKTFDPGCLPRIWLCRSHFHSYCNQRCNNQNPQGEILQSLTKEFEKAWRLFSWFLVAAIELEPLCEIIAVAIDTIFEMRMDA